jgi:hypothetical protein
MRLWTHVIFAFAVTFYIAVRVFNSQNFLFPLAIAWLTNHIIDGLGHERKGPYISRKAGTHSLSGAIIVAAFVSALFYGLTLIPSFVAIPTEYLQAVSYLRVPLKQIVTFNLLSTFSHLFLDLITERGIFFRKKRVGIFGFSGNGIMNSVFIVLSLLLIASAVVPL